MRKKKDVNNNYDEDKGLTQEEYVRRFKNKDNKQTNTSEKKGKSKKRKKTKKKKNGFLSAIKKIFISLILLILILSGLFYYNVQINGGGLKGVLCTIFGQSVENLDYLKPITVLLLGVSQDINTELTDTIILCTYDPRNQTAAMLSIPRDTFIGKNKNSAKGKDKINALYSKGVDKTVAAVSEITGTNIDYYIVVNNNALIEIVNTIGGINFDVPIDMKYDDPTQNLHIDLKAGNQLLDGEKAEQLLRFRHNNDGSSYPVSYGDNDFGRMKTQRSFIMETIKQTLDIKNITKASKITNIIFKNVKTNMKKEDLYDYIPALADFDMESIMNEQLPGASEKCNGLWFFIYNKTQTKAIVDKLNIR